ncbi:MAG: YraN family protein [Burkholderiales bacterium]|nr:YraN family protein [Burkholderiales bacterium]MDP2397229.1 YraN family protein [Burkholderiales bacterium]
MNPRGEAAEALAATFVESRGLRIVARNYRCRHGELDLVARDGDTLVFIEVRRRSGNAFGGAAASINAAKREKLLKTAHHYLAGLAAAPACRFDAVLLSGEPPRIDWLLNVIEE